MSLTVVYPPTHTKPMVGCPTITVQMKYLSNKDTRLPLVLGDVNSIKVIER